MLNISRIFFINVLINSFPFIFLNLNYFEAGLDEINNREIGYRVLAVLNEAYEVQELEDGKERTVLSLKPHLSPIKAAVIPLKKNNEDLVSAASHLKGELQGLGLGRVLVENSGNIGKSYRRHDEVGTPLCITLHFQTLEDQTVTVRNRDSMEQERIHQKETATYLQEILK